MGKSRYIIMTDANPCSIYRVGSHHIIEALTREHKEVICYSTPISIFVLFKLFDKNSRTRIKSFFLQFFIATSWIVPLTLIPYRIARVFFSKKISLILSRPFVFRPNLKKSDTVIIDSTEYLQWIGKLDANKIIYRPTDIYSYASKYNYELEEFFVKNSKIKVICMSEASQTFYQSKFFDVILMVENGVANDFYSKCHEIINNSKVKMRNSLSFVYYGAIDDRIDFDILKKIVTSGYELHVYGLGDKVNELLSCKHLHSCYKGYINYSDIPEVMVNYDIGLLPFNKNVKNISRSPMKLYEYYSCGLLPIQSGVPTVKGVTTIDREGDFDFIVEKYLEKIKCRGIVNVKREFNEIAGEHTWDRKTKFICESLNREFR